MTSLDRLSAVFNKEAARVLEEARRIAEHHLATKHMLVNETKLFLDTGIAKITMDLDNRVGCLAPAVAHFHEVAKEHNRFVLLAKEQRVYNTRIGYTDTLAFTMPRTKRLQNVIASMLLVAHECPNGDSSLYKSPVAACHSPGMWRLFFNGPEGLDRFDAFRERCHTDPILRITLRLNG